MYLVTWARSGGDEGHKRWEADLLNQSPVLSSSRNTLLFVAPARSPGAELTRKVALRALAKKQPTPRFVRNLVPACLFGIASSRQTIARQMLHSGVLTDDRFAGRLTACFWLCLVHTVRWLVTPPFLCYTVCFPLQTRLLIMR